MSLFGDQKPSLTLHKAQPPGITKIQRTLYWTSISSRSLRNCLWFNPRDNIKLTALTTTFIISLNVTKIKCHQRASWWVIQRNFNREWLIQLCLKWYSKRLTKPSYPPLLEHHRSWWILVCISLNSFQQLHEGNHLKHLFQSSRPWAAPT